MEILHEAATFLVVVKPAGLLSEDAAGGDSVPARLAPTYGRVFAVHRLDRGVGGVMVYARTKEAAAALSRAVAEGKLQKEYVAVVAGEPTPKNGDMHDLLYHDARQNKTFAVKGERKGAKEAHLSYRTMQTVMHGEDTLSRVSVRLHTGRSHQIRAQFATRHHPLAGDGKYGSRLKCPIALFATYLAFPDPESGKPLHFSAPVPSVYPFDLFAASNYEIERKFLIAYPDIAALLAMEGCTKKEMEQTYLLAERGETLRVRKTVCEGKTSYRKTRKLRMTPTTAVEEEWELDKGEYATALQSADPARRTVIKTRYCVPFEGHVIEIDVYPFWSDRAIAEVELKDEHEIFAFPPAVTPIREVTDDKRYKNVHLAKSIPNDTI